MQHFHRLIVIAAAAITTATGHDTGAPPEVSEPAPASAPAASEPATQPAPLVLPLSPPARGSAAPVKVHDHIAFTVYAARGEQSAKERADRAARALEAAIEDDEGGEVEVDLGKSQAIFRAGKRVLFVADTDDARAEGESSLEAFAQRRASELGAFLKAERTRALWQHIVLGICLVVSLGFVSVLFLRKLGQWGQEARAWLESEDRLRSPNRVMRLLVDTKLSWVLTVVTFIVQFVVQLLVIYLFLIGALSLFDNTRNASERMSAILSAPFLRLASNALYGVISSIPSFLALLLMLVVVRAGFHVINVTFGHKHALPSGLRGLPLSTLSSVRVLAYVALILSALLLLSPLVTGDSNHLFTRIGFVMLLLLALATLPMLVNCAVGMWLLIGRHLRPGETIEIGAALRGEVAGLNFFYVRLKQPGGTGIDLPHLVLLFKPIHRIGTAVHLRLPVPRTMPPSAARQRLEAECEKFAKAHAGAGTPTVQLESIDAAMMWFEIEIAALPADKTSALLVALGDAVFMP